MPIWVLRIGFVVMASIYETLSFIIISYVKYGLLRKDITIETKFK
jgi:hypothetical protein